MLQNSSMKASDLADVILSVCEDFGLDYQKSTGLPDEEIGRVIFDNFANVLARSIMVATSEVELRNHILEGLIENIKEYPGWSDGK
jgi:hypothetical protein